MIGRIRVKELTQKRGLRGKIVNLFPSWRTGIIQGDDGYDVTFSDDSLVVGRAYGDLSLGMRVSYGVFFGKGAKVPTAINMQRLQADQTEEAGEAAAKVTSRQVATGTVS